MLIISLSSFCAIFTLNIHYNGDDGKPVPNFIQSIFFKFIGRIVYVSYCLDYHRLFIISFVKFGTTFEDIEIKNFEGNKQKKLIKYKFKDEIIEKIEDSEFKNATCQRFLNGKNNFNSFENIDSVSSKNELPAKPGITDSSSIFDQKQLIKSVFIKLSKNLEKAEVDLEEQAIKEKIKKQW